MSEASGQPVSMVEKLNLIRAIGGCRLPAYERNVLTLLASLINGKTGLAFPGRRILAGLANIQERHVSRTLNELERRGLLTIVEPGTRRRAARYRLEVVAILTLRGSVDVPVQGYLPCLPRHVRGAWV